MRRVQNLSVDGTCAVRDAFAEQEDLIERPPADNAVTGAYLAAEVDAMTRADERCMMHHFDYGVLVERRARLFALSSSRSPHVFTAMVQAVQHGGGWRVQGLIVPPAWRGHGRGTDLLRRVVGQLEREGARGYVDAAIRVMPSGRWNEASLRTFLRAVFVPVPGIHTVAIVPSDPTASHLLATAEPDGRSYRYLLVMRPLQLVGRPAGAGEGVITHVA